MEVRPERIKLVVALSGNAEKTDRTVGTLSTPRASYW
jgi:hypothetical protein